MWFSPVEDEVDLIVRRMKEEEEDCSTDRKSERMGVGGGRELTQGLAVKVRLRKCSTTTQTRIWG